MTGSNKQKTDKAHCNSCGQETNHSILASHERRFGEPEPDWEIYVINTYEMLACCGCGSITMRRSSWFSEEPRDTSVNYYPPAVSRNMPQWASKLPPNERSLLDEVYAALHAGSHRLAMMGARALIDVALVSRVGDHGAFTRTLAEGESQGLISSHNRNVLDAAFDAGSAAAHRGHRATPQQVGQVIDIVENLLQSVYVLETLADELRQNTPARQPRR